MNPAAGPASPMSDPHAIALLKKQVRQGVRTAVAALTEPQRREASRLACERIEALPMFTAARMLMLYLSLPGEADCTPLILRRFQLGRPVCVPRVDWTRRTMEAVQIASLAESELDVGKHGVRAPRTGTAIARSHIDAVIVPGMAFDVRGWRLGRAGGFYDRFLAGLAPGTLTIGLAFDCQIVDELPVAPHDVPVRMVVTERRVIVADTAGRAGTTPVF